MAVSLLRRAFVCAVGAALAWALACVARVPVTSGTTTVTPLWFDPTAAVNQVDERFLSVTMDWHLPSEEWPAWGNASVLNANLQSALLRRLARALGPAFLRIGGSEVASLPCLRGWLGHDAEHPPDGRRVPLLVARACTPWRECRQTW